MSPQHPAGADPEVFSLDDEAATDAGRAGQKAANLGRLSRLGFPVPPGIVVSTSGVDRIRARGTVPDDLHDLFAPSVPVGRDLRLEHTG